VRNAETVLVIQALREAVGMTRVVARKAAYIRLAEKMEEGLYEVREVSERGDGND
jgi:hypothetical protein